MTILQRGSSRHVHSYRKTPAIAGFARMVCTVCRHVSIDSPDAAIPSAATTRKTGLFGATPPRLGSEPAEAASRANRGRKFGVKVEPA